MSSSPLSPLRRCHGYSVRADDGVAGTVETPLFPPDAGDPDYLVVRAAADLGARRAVVPAALVRSVAADERTVWLRVSRASLARLPETLPLMGKPPSRKAARAGRGA